MEKNPISTPAQQSPPGRRSLRLGEPETSPDHIPLHLGVALLRLSQDTVLVLFFFRLILESLTLLSCPLFANVFKNNI